MPKTITVRVDDTTYDKIKTAADSEMNSIVEDTGLINNLKMSLENIQSGKYRIVE